VKVRKGIILTGSCLFIVLLSCPASGQKFGFDGCDPSRVSRSSTAVLTVPSLISIPFQSNYDFKLGTGSGWQQSARRTRGLWRAIYRDATDTEVAARRSLSGVTNRRPLSESPKSNAHLTPPSMVLRTALKVGTFNPRRGPAVAVRGPCALK
jgi:hypothetical protein